MNNLQRCQWILLKGPTASATTEMTASFDTSTYGGNYVAIAANVNAEANTNSTNVVLTVSHADTNSATNYSSIATVLIDNTAAAGGVVIVPMKGKKRYLKAFVTPDTTTNGAVIVGGIFAVVNPELIGLTNQTTVSVAVAS